MRALLLALAFAATAAPALAQPAAPTAQAAYAERRALLEADRVCTLFDPGMRAALVSTAGQARGALLRGGWTMARIGELESAAVAAARSRRCGDERTEAAANRARLGYGAWARTHAMTFTGVTRSWLARRTPDPADQWMLRQEIDAPRAATFGLRGFDGHQELTLILPLTANGNAPGAAELLLRDPARARNSQMDVPGRTARGLAAGAPAPAWSRGYQAQARRIETVRGQRRALFLFPAAAADAMASLDPREAAEIRLGDGTRLYVEIGDFAAARAFLAAQLPRS